MINPNNAIHRERLRKAREWSWQQMAPARETHNRLTRQYVGDNYGTGTADMKKLMNLQWQTASAVVTSLVPNNVQYQIESIKADQKSVNFASRFELHLNNLVKSMYLSKMLSASVLDSWFKLGIAYLWLKDSIAVEIEQDIFMDPGTPGVSHVSIYDYVQDMSVRRRSQRTFEGHCYEVSWESLRGAHGVDKKVVDAMKANGNDYLYQPDRPKNDEASTVDDDARTEPVVKLIDVFLPRERLVCTFPHKLDTPPLRVLPSGFSDCGPYPHLYYDEIPDQLLPISPAEQVEGLDKLINSGWRKMSRQARRARDIPIYEPGAADDARNVQAADDGQWTKVKKKDSVGVLKMGGVDPGIQQFTMWAADQFNLLAGNPRAILGAGPQSDTAAQDQMIQNQVNAMMQRRQDRVRDFVTDIGKGLGDLLWRDQSIRDAYVSLKSDPSLKAPSRWSTERVGDRMDYMVNLSPYAMPNRTPQQKSAMLQAWVANQGLNLIPMAQQAGRQFQFDTYMEMLSELEGMNEFQRLFGISEPSEPEGGQHGPTKPNSSRREYVRKSMGVQDQSGGMLRQQLASAAMADQGGGMVSAQ